MATVYSLVCFGGLSGKTVTFTDAGDVVNLTNHGLRQGVTGIVFSTTGSLPTGITAGTTYYPRDGADANKFTIYPTKADALAGTNQVTFTGTGSGTHTVKSAYMLGLSAEQLARYGSSGSERIYNGIYAWNSAMAARSEDVDIEYCEIGEIFSEIASGTTYVTINTLLGAGYIWTKVNGARSPAFHNGVIGSGYIFLTNSGFNALNINAPYLTVDGFEVRNIGSGSGIFSSSILTNILSMVAVGKGIGNTTASGIVNNTGAQKITNNISIGWANGLLVYPYNSHGTVANNIFCKNSTGIKNYQSTNINGVYINNIFVGNTKNYERQSSPNKATNNVGEIGDKSIVTVDDSTDIFTLTGNLIVSGAKVVFTSSGTLPSPLQTGAVYYARDITTDTFKVAATSGGTAINITDTGSGTHYLSSVWDTKGTAIHIDLANKNSIWMDYDNNDFRLATGSPLINTGTDYFGADLVDIADDVRPNYQPTIYPNEVWDVGPFEYDHGNGLSPQQVTLAISGMAEGSALALYKTSDGSAIISPTTIGASGSYSTTYSYTGDTQVEVVVRKGTSGTKYLPYSAPGLVTSAGFSLIVNQVIDGVLNG